MKDNKSILFPNAQVNKIFPKCDSKSVKTYQNTVKHSLDTGWEESFQFELNILYLAKLNNANTNFSED
jgi:hypothetical protein